MSSDDFVQFMESLQTTKNLIMDPSRSVSTSTYAKITIRMYTIDGMAVLVVVWTLMLCILSIHSSQAGESREAGGT